MSKVIETFYPPGFIETCRLGEAQQPTCFNGIVRVHRYRITIEEIKESKEVIKGRLIDLWETSDNHHDYNPIQQKAKKLGIELPDTFGKRRKKQ